MSLPVTLWAQDNLVPVAHQAYAPKVQVSIIIDDLGLRLEQDLRVLALPGAITNAVLPKATHTHRIAALADRLDKEVIIHLPMESLNYGQLDAGGLTAGMSQQAFKQVVESAIAAVPEAVGINNHMGSLLTADPERMRWLMEVIDQQTDLYFVDSRTSVKSVAFRYARDSGIPALSRDIFLDNDLDEAKIERQFDAMIAVAKRRGKAIAIGHPNRQTIAVLERRLPTLAKLGVELVSVSELLQPKVQRVPSPSFELELSPVRIAKRDSYEEFILQSGVLGSRQPVRFFSLGETQ